MTTTFAITNRIVQLQELKPTDCESAYQIDLLNELAWLMVERSRDEAEQMAMQAKHACTAASFSEQPYEVGIAHANITLAHIAFRLADYETAIRLCHDAQFHLDSAGSVVRMAYAYATIAICYSELGNTIEASKYFYKGMELATKENDQFALTRLHHDLALMESSQERLERALERAKNIGDEEMEALASANLVYMFLTEQGDFERAERLLDTATSIYEQIECRPIMAYVLTVRGDFYHLQGENELATNSYEQSLEISRNCKDSILIGLGLRSYAKFEQSRGNYDRAIAHLIEGAELAKDRQQSLMLVGFYKLLAQVFEQKGVLDEALATYKKYSALSESLESEQRVAQHRFWQISHQAEVDRREAQFEREKNTELEKRVSERTNELQASLEREHALTIEVEAALAAEAELSALKSKIITNVSHEFRTPLTVINNSAELLEKYYEKLSSEQRAKNLSRVRSSIAQLTGMLNDVGLLNEGGPRAIEPVLNILPLNDVAEQLRHHQHCHVLSLPRARYSFDALDDQPITTDVALLARIMGNLLKNSVKFSAENTPITVKLLIEAENLVLTVQDEGVGVLEEDQAKVFDLFYRGKNAGNRRGLGIGLNVVQKLVHALDGTIGLESMGEDMGTTFTVKVPCRVIESSEFVAVI